VSSNPFSRRDAGLSKLANVFWLFLALVGLAALGYYVIYPAIVDIQARKICEDLVREAEDEGDALGHRVNLPGKAGQTAIDYGKRTLSHINMGLKHYKVWVREKAIHVVEKITKKSAWDWGYDHQGSPDREDNARAIQKIEEWYKKVKDDPNVK
jgi:hypothetical protein